MKQTILEVKYSNWQRENNGSIKVVLNEFLPATQKNFRILLRTCELSDDLDGHVKKINEYIAARIDELKKLRKKFNQEDKKQLSIIDSEVKKLLALNKILVKDYGAEEIGDTENKQNQKEEVKTMKKNTNNYFEGIKTLEELRTKYRDLLKANHPDNGGSVEVTQAINTEYKKAFDLLKSGANLESESTKLKWNEEQDANLREALYKVIHLDGLNIEIVGCWIWIDGNTYDAKEVLKEAGYKWSRNRQKWHYSPYESKFHKGGKKTFDELRRCYGSTEIEKETCEKIA